MSDSSDRHDTGPPPTPPPSPPPEIVPEPSVWDNADADAPTEANQTVLPPIGDSQPTIISRQLPRTGEEMLGALRGKRLAHFELIAPIGVGGMAAVIKGRDLQLERTVALKILPPEMAADPENIRRFHHEARAAAKLDHENIARVFFYGEDQRLHFIAFEFVQGDNLRAIIERRGRLPVGEAVHYILQVATGLAHAANRGVVHRDIKPSNIIITPNGRAKLVDMGLARSLTPQDDRQLTQSGVTLGTFDYISPEQALEPREADVRSDIYSLGCTFYHVLTGQPPVPEGTAARKLHFHEHELAIDPRQLNPSIPDEVAAIIGRMMAKNPRERYQKAEHLVEQLLRVAQKLDSGHEQADGVLYVDAPLPTRSTRPLFLVALAVAAVVALIFTLEQPGPQRGSIPRASNLKPSGQQAGPETPPEKKADKPEPPRDLEPRPAASPDRFVFPDDGTVDGLKQWAKKRPRTADVELEVASDLVLFDDGGDNGAVLALSGRTVTIKAAADAKPTPTIRLFYSSSVPKGTPITALRLEAAQVVLQGLRIEVAAGAAAQRTGVHLVGGESHRIENCQFIQKAPQFGGLPVRSVLLDGAKSGSPQLTLRECVFLGEEFPDPAKPEAQRLGRGGSQAVVRRGPGRILAEDCGFGPHQSNFRLEGDFRGDPDLQLTHCSFLLTDASAAFHLDSQATSNVNAKYNLFSRLSVGERKDDSITASTGAILIRQDGVDAANAQTFTYDGFDNRYHDLDGFWGVLNTNGEQKIDSLAVSQFESFRKLINDGKAQDGQSGVLLNSPWKEERPLLALVRADFADAFAVRQDVKELRLARSPQTQLVGARRVSGRVYVDGKLPDLRDSQPGDTARKLYVDPTLKERGGGQYRSLEAALADALAGDVISIRHNGKLDVKALQSDSDVTIRPDSGYRPTLTLATEKPDVALFTLTKGKLKLQELDFLLEPGQKADGAENTLAQAVVSLDGDGKVDFVDCTITLGEPRDHQLAAVALGQSNRKPFKSGELIPSGPVIGFERCVVRGKGDLLWCRSSRPFELRASQSLFALNGSLVLMEGSKYAEALPLPGPVDPGPRCLVTLEHVSAATVAPLFHLRAAGPLRSLVPVKCQANKCVLASLGNKPLLLLADLEAKVENDTALRDRFDWMSGTNAFGTFTAFVEYHMKSAEMMMMGKPFGRERWKEYTADTDSKFEAVKISIVETSSLRGVRPGQFAVMDLADFGANIANLEPRRDEK